MKVCELMNALFIFINEDGPDGLLERLDTEVGDVQLSQHPAQLKLVDTTNPEG